MTVGTGGRMGRVAVMVALALCLLGCSPAAKGEPIELLTGVESCYAGGQSPVYAGVLVPDPQYGTRINGRPVMWMVGYTGVRVWTGEIYVLNRSGIVVARTGHSYAISPAPQQREEAQQIMDRLGAIAAPDCYDHDFEEVAPKR